MVESSSSIHRLLAQKARRPPGQKRRPRHPRRSVDRRHAGAAVKYKIDRADISELDPASREHEETHFVQCVADELVDFVIKCADQQVEKAGITGDRKGMICLSILISVFARISWHVRISSEKSPLGAGLIAAMEAAFRSDLKRG